MAIPKLLGSYEIGGLLGSGGMGEVYRARDLKLGRSVAVKVLPEAVAQDSERIARFEREAKLLASLNHANVATLHGLEKFGETHFLVMELVEGETLADRIKRGPLAVEEALTIVRQIAEALEAAHENGIVHRDLKPANVKITPDDKVKVLDFGLAKAMENAPVNVTLSNSPTLSLEATQAGVILGTAAYMSPEQAKGVAVDSRSDVFSLGCVIYEMLSGRPAFQGETVSEIIAAVLIREPDFSALPSDLNPGILELLRRCLEKNPRRRWQAIGDLRMELERIAAAPRAIASGQAAIRIQPMWRRAIPLLVTAIVFSVIASFAGWSLTRPAPIHAMRMPFVLPEGQRFQTADASHPLAISPDGTHLVYSANNQLFLKSVGEWEAHAIAGTEDTERNQNLAEPFFSSDGQWVGFYSREDSTLKKVAVTGGAPVPIFKTGPIAGASWDGDQIVYGQGSGIMRISANGGEPVVIVSRKNPSERFHGPQTFDGGRSLLFTMATETGRGIWDKAQIVVQSLTTGERTTVIRGGTDARYLPTGHLVYALGGTVFAVPFDVQKRTIQGSPISILEGVMRAMDRDNAGTGASHFAISDTGTLAYVPSNESGNAAQSSRRTLALMDRTGKLQQALPLEPKRYADPRISPDGKYLAFSINDGKQASIWVYELKGASQPRRLTFGGTDSSPAWTPDSLSITFHSLRNNVEGLYQQRVDGSPAEQLTSEKLDGSPLPESWFGKTLLLRRGAAFQVDIWLLSQNGEKKLSALVPASTATSKLRDAVFSPDGKWFAYSSDELGRSQIFVQPFPTTGVKHQITTEVAGSTSANPLWSPDSKQLFYIVRAAANARVGRFTLMTADIQTSPGFGLKTPVSTPFAGLVAEDRRQYDITHDGKQFVVILPPASQADSRSLPARQQINIEYDWFEELKQRVPIR